MADLFDILLGKNLAGGGGGGGSVIAYSSIVDNGDNTITATDDKGVEHIISYTVGADGKITSVTLDGKTQSVSYDENNVLMAIGETEVDIEGVPIANEFPVTVTFMNGTEEWAKVGVNENGKVGKPVDPPIPEGYAHFDGWYDGTVKIDFPYNPQSNKILSPNFVKLRTEMEIDDAGATIYTIGGSEIITKAKAGKAIIGYFARTGTSSKVIIPIVISLTDDASACEMSGVSYGTGTQGYNGKTYHYATAPSYTTISDIAMSEKAYGYSIYSGSTDIYHSIERCLSHYFYAD